MNRFPLTEGDRVEFVSIKGERQEGTLLRRPYGRRLHAVVRDDARRLHYVPNRGFITRRVQAATSASNTRSS